MEIIYYIREERLKQNLSVRDLAKLSRVSKSYISDVENNKKHPNLLILYKISEALNVEISIIHQRIM